MSSVSLSLLLTASDSTNATLCHVTMLTLPCCSSAPQKSCWCPAASFQLGELVLNQALRPDVWQVLRGVHLKGCLNPRALHLQASEPALRKPRCYPFRPRLHRAAHELHLLIKQCVTARSPPRTRLLRSSDSFGYSQPGIHPRSDGHLEVLGQLHPFPSFRLRAHATLRVIADLPEVGELFARLVDVLTDVAHAHLQTDILARKPKKPWCNLASCEAIFFENAGQDLHPVGCGYSTFTPICWCQDFSFFSSIH